MFKKATWLHLRLPFSYFLLPIFLLALSISHNLSEEAILWLFIILHIFIYPASNAFNSYFDKDEGSIGGLKNPPKVDRNVLYMANLFDTLGLALTLWFFWGNWVLAAMLVVYIGVSRAYSHPMIRLKKFAFLSWFIAGFFQGAWVVWTVYIGLNDFAFSSLFKAPVLIPGLLASAILWGSYPMTQVYQHREDSKRGDYTLSIRLGILGTFHFTAICFAVATLAFCLYFQAYWQLFYAWPFLLAMLPVLLFFGWWYLKVLKDSSMANFTNTMRLNFISATCLGGFFLYFFLHSSHVLNVVGLY